jgi:alkylation response protein AidB-like acyl-CoA dehydrogenase
MQFSFNAEQQMLRESLANIVEPWQPNAHRTAPCPAQLWRTLADSGMTGVCVGPEAGGSGLGLVEAGCILEALGAILDDGVFLPSAVLAAHLLSCGKGDGGAELLASLAIGSTKAAVLISQNLDGAFSIQEGHIQGYAGPTLGLDRADCVLLVVQGQGSDLATLHVFPADAPELITTALPLPDDSREVHAVHLRSLNLETAKLRLALPRDAALMLRPLAVAAQSAQMLGGAEAVLQLSCQYARERVQFGGPIGRFQSLKHLLADGRVMLDGLRSLSYAALWQLGAGTSDAPATAYAAKIWASDVYGRLASDAIQVFGAMGIASESQPHRYLKRSLADRVIFGASPLYVEALHDFNVRL